MDEEFKVARTVNDLFMKMLKLSGHMKKLGLRLLQARSRFFSQLGGLMRKLIDKGKRRGCKWYLNGIYITKELEDMCLCVCVHIYICTCVHIYVCTCVYIYMYEHVCVHICMHVCTYICMHMCVCEHIYLCACMYIELVK